MNITKKAFQSALEKVAPLAGKRTHLPILSALRLEAKGGMLEIVASNLDCFATAKAECAGELEPVCIPASYLNALVAGANESIKLGVIQGQRVSFESNGSANIAYLPADEFVALPSEKAKKVGIPSKDLAECIRAVDWAVNLNKGDILLESVWVKAEAKSITTAASDRIVMGCAKKAIISADAEFLFPALYSRYLCDALEGESGQLSLSTNYVVATSASLSTAVKLVNQPYFHIEKMISMEREPIGQIDRALFMDALRSAITVCDGDYCPVKVEFGGDGISLEYSGSQNEYKTTIPSSATGKTIRFDASEALRVLKNTIGDSIKAFRIFNNIFIENGDFITAFAVYGDKKI